MAEEDNAPPKPRRKSGSAKRQRQGMITFRVTDEERAELAKSAERAGLAIGSFIRAQVLASPKTAPRRRPLPEVQTILRLQGELNRVGGNIHQILKRVNFGETPLGYEFREALTGYREVIQDIRATLGWVKR